MKLSDFDYNLPKELIAQFPPPRRQDARLLVLDRRNGAVKHRKIRDILDYLEPGDVVALNNTKVVNARVKGRDLRRGREAELLLLRHNGSGRFRALIRPLSKLKIGDELVFEGNGLRAKIVSKDEVEFNSADTDEIYRYGQVPLPPYIRRPPSILDEERYQTVFARREGAVAAPTAGLHFDGELLEMIKVKGAALEFVTLHVGPGTFRPVRDEDVSRHAMEKEDFLVGGPVAARLRLAKEAGGKIIAVGTTTTRVLETIAVNAYENLCSCTDIFIYPGFKFRCVDRLLTNFHLPWPPGIKETTSKRAFLPESPLAFR